MLPPGAAARSPTAAVSPAPGRPATRPRSSLAPAAVLLFPACDCPNRKSRQLARLGDGWPTREHLAGWRGGDQTGQVPLPSIRQAEVHRYEYIANGADRASQPIRSSFNSPAQKRGRRIRAGVSIHGVPDLPDVNRDRGDELLLLGVLVLLPLPVRRWKIAGKHAPAVVQDRLRHHAYRRRGMQPWACRRAPGRVCPGKLVGGAGRRGGYLPGDR